ncbi:ComEC/Rec2 family competence protein [Estrella lausannensis]|uniref:Putative competence protein n=1 Tax=Estrella lausannensis TaxID=483423 RepID=A0A0H5E5N3_9BACT|nr:ComEC/Rec2 family competence protein [Estrella lausannensis]CRX38545.1 putative competence protein [Estrella lausannensis]
MAISFRQQLTSLRDTLNPFVKTLETYHSFSIRWSQFFQKAPLLLLSIGFLLGIALATEKRIVLGVVASLLLVLSLKSKNSWALVLFFSLGILYAAALVKVPPKGSSALSGTALFHPDSISPIKQSGKDALAFKGTIQYFAGSDGVILAKNIPSAFSIKDFQGPLPSSDSAWTIKGVLQEGKGRLWKFKPTSPVFWKEEPKTFSWNKMREGWKFQLKSYIQKNIPGEKNQNLIAGMVTGSFSDQEITQGFQRFGLQHILAISGFHFSLFALIATMLLKPFFKGKILLILLTLSVTSYFIFLGPTPSVQRAWVMIVLSQAASVFERRISPFNALGAALFLTLLYDPLSLQSPGFILSFAITLSILAFTPLSTNLLDALFPQRTFEEASQMSGVDKMGFIAFNALKKMTALNLAVHAAALPLTLALFGSFPLLSILFNLFFPTLAGFVIFLFILSALLYTLFEPIGTALFALTSKASNLLLSFALDMPASWNIQLSFSLAADWAIALSFLLLILAVAAGQKVEETGERAVF